MNEDEAAAYEAADRVFGRRMGLVSYKLGNVKKFLEWLAAPEESEAAHAATQPDAPAVEAGHAGTEASPLATAANVEAAAATPAPPAEG